MKLYQPAAWHALCAVVAEERAPLAAGIEGQGLVNAVVHVIRRVAAT